MSEDNKDKDWNNYRALVLDNFKRINKRLEEIEVKFDDLKDNHFHSVAFPDCRKNVSNCLKMIL